MTGRCLLFVLVLGGWFGLQAQDLSEGPWRLWVDRQAQWKSDKVYLPEEVDLKTLPVNPPTGGWGVLNGQAGQPVTLPSTVEEHDWAKFSPRPIRESKGYPPPGDKYLQDGSYLGVSWWYRPFTAPTLGTGDRLLLHIRGARLRTEVYVNGRLCGYSIMTELPVEADLTSAVHSGAHNLLAIRITNAGGRLDWKDKGTFQWGSAIFPSSISAGGLDSGITLEVVAATHLSDLAVFNQLDPHSIRLQAEITNQGADFSGNVLFSLRDRDQKVIGTVTVPVSVKAGEVRTIGTTTAVPEAALWTLESPTLYTATAELVGVPHTAETRTFGFRSFTAVGLGHDAKLLFNQHRIVIRSAISWGFWAPNLIWPTSETAQRELENAKAMGLNCIQSHRNLSKVAVLDSQDRGGLFRYEEPGSGINALGGLKPAKTKPNLDLSGNGGEPKTFTQKYEEEKILQMIRRDRSHPSLIVYCVQNELSTDLSDPRIFNLIRKMHAADPSRTVLLKSGIAPDSEVFMLPEDETVYHDDGTGYSGWRDEHTVGGPGTWSRSLYEDPTHYSHRSDDNKQIVMWGEMLGSGTPDDHRGIVQDYASSGATGYDAVDQKWVDQAYANFLAKYHFTQAFPTTSDLYRSVAAKSYNFWARMLENVRACDATDYIVVSGWESTDCENHSGIVDSHRFPKGDPAVIKRANAPLMLVVRPRRFVLSTGESNVVDVFLVNEINLTGPATLNLSAIGPDGQSLFHSSERVSVHGGDVFGQLLQAATPIPASNLSGSVTLTAILLPAQGLPSGATAANLTRSEVVNVIETLPLGLPARIVVAAGTPDFLKVLKDDLEVRPLPVSALHDPQPVDAILYSQTSDLRLLQVKGVVLGTDDASLYAQQIVTGKESSTVWSGFAPGKLQVDLYFAEIEKELPNERVANVDLNGVRVLSNFDILSNTGGKNLALIKSFTVPTTDGRLTLQAEGIKDRPAIAAIRISDSAGQVRRIVFRDAPYTDPRGDVWEATPPSFSPRDEAALDASLVKVHDQGGELILWPDRGSESAALATRLAARKILTFQGVVGSCRAPWMGSWYFVRDTPLFAGLPVNTAFDQRYELPQSAAGENGLLLDAPGLDVVVGYGRDHDPNVGIGLCTIPYGKGTIILSSIGSLVSGLEDSKQAIARPIALRLLENALRWK